MDKVKEIVSHLPKEIRSEVEESVLDKINQGVLYEETHLHSKEQFYADNPPKKVVEKFKEFGFETVFLTQHGVAAMTWEYKEVVAKAGLKFVPGLETDYQSVAVREVSGLYSQDKSEPVSRLVLHAADDIGWKAIGMAISASQTVDGRTLMSDKVLEKYFGRGSIGYGHVIATSSNIEGPISQIYKENILAEKAVALIAETRDKKTGGIIPESYLDKLRNKIDELKVSSLEIKEELKEHQKTAQKDFTKMDAQLKEIGKLKGESSEEYINFYLELSDKKKIVLQSSKEVDRLEAIFNKTNKRKTALSGELRAFEKLALENLSFQDEMDSVLQKVTPVNELDRKATEKLLYFDELFGHGYFYVEIQNHGSKEQKTIFPRVVDIARKNNIPLLASNDVYMLTNSEDEILKREILKTTEDPKNPSWRELTPAEKEAYIKDSVAIKESLLKLFDEDVVEEAMLNTLVVSSMCRIEFKVENHHPKFIDDNGRTSDELFEDLIQKGIDKKFNRSFSSDHQKRLDHEIDVMKTMGYVDYHLIVNDFNQYASEYDAIPFDRIPDAPLDRKSLIEWKKVNGYNTPVGLTNGTGRGSAVGSLVCDLLDITHLDPLKYELLFERFLNPERVSMPDIDSDISRTVRPIVIDYVENKYGKKCVAGIITQNAQAPKGAIRIAAKAYGLYLNRYNYKDNGAKQFLVLADRIAKLVPSIPGTSFDSLVDDGDVTVYHYLENVFSEDKNALEIIKWAKAIEGCFTAYGAHAAGIVITDGVPVSEITPLRWNDKLHMYTTQCDMVVAEEIGMLKFDMLGLKTVDIINDTLWEIYKSGVVIDTNKLPLDDKDVYANIFAKGKTDSIFQFESSGMKQMLKRFQPENFEDLIILVSMFRPGPLQYLDDVIDVKHGRKPLKFLTPELEPILGKTYGAITYQEQVMQIFQQLAGYTLGGADLVRRFMSKKKMDKLNQERNAFVYGDETRNIKGCIANGIDEKAAGELFDQMTDFAKYAFNKSHAAAYAYNAYITGYLKHHYPAEFMMAAMRWAEKKVNHDPIPGLMAEAKSMGIEVYPPDINHSGINFNVENGRILFGLGSVASVASYSKEIIEERKNGKYVDFFDYFKRTRAKKDATKNLILAGAFDDFYDNRKSMVELVDDVQEIAKAIKEKESFVETCEAILPYIDSLETDQDVIDRQEELNVKVHLKKVTTSSRLLKRIESAKNKIDELTKSFNDFYFSPDIKEALSERLANEKKFIGAYITGHPLDDYESAKTLNATTLSDIDEDTQVIYGLISSVSIKKRKSDGKPMAFIEVEDKYKTIKVSVFAEVYEKHKSFIKEGVAILIEGKSKVIDSDDEDIINYEFIASKFSNVNKREHGFLLKVSSLAVFHIDEESEFRKRYELKTGHLLKVFDLSMRELRTMLYKVSPDVIEFNNVSKL